MRLLLTKKPGSRRDFFHPKYWVTWIGLGCLRLLILLPLPLSHFAGSLFGIVLFILFRSRRKVVEQNLRLCFPGWSRGLIYTTTFNNFCATGRGLVDTGLAWWASRKRLQRLVHVKGQENFSAAQKTGRPVIILAGHFVAIDIAGMYISSLQNITSIYKKPKNELLHWAMVNGRLHFGTMTLVETKEGVKPILQSLKRREPFYFPGDQDFGPAKSVFVPFFGVQAATVPTLSRLAKMSNAVILPCFAKQLPWGKGYEVIFGRPVDDRFSGDELQDTELMNRVIEHEVKEMPEQYFWMHKRFKTRPENDDRSFYV
ncbi:MAG: lysophospholipid acyltransferase family protein [Gammaproteobacteria bacterium]|nr:lysophospholipid acyltransferase family protein [Gammaproteobacteria bacterium]